MKLWNSRRLITATLTLALVTVASVSWGQGLVGGGTLSLGSKDLSIRHTGTGYVNKFRNGYTGNLIGTKSWADSAWATHHSPTLAATDTTAPFNPFRDLPDYALGIRGSTAGAAGDSFYVFTLQVEEGSDGPQTTTSHGIDIATTPMDSVFITMQTSHDNGVNWDALPTITLTPTTSTNAAFRIYNSTLFTGAGNTNATFMAHGPPMFRFIVAHGDAYYPVQYRLVYPQFNR